MEEVRHDEAGWRKMRLGACRKGATPGLGDLPAESLRSFDPENDEYKRVE